MLLLFSAIVATAQESALARARALRDDGDLAGAARLLESHLAGAPGDGEAARLLGETFYWMREFDRARAVYESAMARNPEDDRLRLDYATMLARTGEPAAARTLLAALRDRPATRTEVVALLGTLEYWEGDLTAAARLFTEVLRADPLHADARRQLQEIQAASASWLRIGAAIWRDDQPVTRGEGGFELGWFATPLMPVRVRAQPMRFSSDDRSLTVWALEADLRHFAPAARLDTEVAIGLLRHPLDERTVHDWTGRGVAGVRAPGHLTFRGRVERSAYLQTVSSLDSSVIARMFGGEVRLDHPRGFAGEAAFQRRLFPDDNAVRTVYGWILAPIVRGGAGGLQGGYAFSADHARESRSVLVQPARSSGPRPVGASLAARYDPYYTPSHLLKQAAIGALTLGARGTTLRVGGSYAVHAREDAPEWRETPSGVQRFFVRRSFSPWDLRASLDVAAGPAATVTIAGETGRSAFYEWAQASVLLTYRWNAVRDRPGAIP